MIRKWDDLMIYILYIFDKNTKIHRLDASVDNY